MLLRSGREEKSVKKSILIMLVVSVFSAIMPVRANDWVKVSSWSYNDVSNFRKEGMLPDSFNEISDYTEKISRLQFAELVYSVLIKSKVITERDGGNSDFLDVKSGAASALKGYRIMEGEKAGVNEYKVEQFNFYPDRLLSREEMAAVLYRTVQWFCPHLLKEINVNDGFVSREETEKDNPSDFEEVSDWAKEAVRALFSCKILNGTENKAFEPESNLTVEQAITAVYRIYNNIPTVAQADGANIISDIETQVQIYSNGITEAKKGNILYLKNGNEYLMEFETDIYSNVFCSTVGNTVFAIAQNGEKADVYNVNTKKLVFRIPYPIYGADNEYIYIKSSVIGPMRFGLYDYNGKEILKPQYSFEEINELRNNDFLVPQQEYRTANGWIYYADWNDNGHMYKIDSNGENKQKLSDNDCFNIQYINGWLYYSVRGEDENKLYVMKADGTNEQRLTENKAGLLYSEQNEFISDSFVLGSLVVATGNGDYKTGISDDKWVYYIENTEDNQYGQIWRVSMSDLGAEKECVSKDIKVRSSGTSSSSAIQYKDGKLYFTDYEKYREKGFTDLYLYSEGSLTRINGDMNIQGFAFNDDKLVMGVYNKGIDTKREYEIYMSEPDGQNPYLYKKGVSDNSLLITVDENTDTAKPETWTFERINEEQSDENYTVYYRTEGHIDEKGESHNDSMQLRVKDKYGNSRLVCADSWEGGFQRLGDVLYYPAVDSDAERESHTIYAYDMKTGNQRKCINNVKSLLNYHGQDWIMYVDYNLNYHRYNVISGTDNEIYPNNGYKKYGNLQSIMIKDNAMHKLDTDGNFSRITEDFVMYWTYVENGSARGIKSF